MESVSLADLNNLAKQMILTKPLNLWRVHQDYYHKATSPCQPYSTDLDTRTTSVAFSPDGKSVASGSFDNTIRMWDALGPSQIGEPLTGHHDKIWSISYSALGNVIASGSWDKTIRLWDVNTHRQMGELLKSDHEFHSIAFSPNAKLIASVYGSTGKTVQLWDVQMRKCASDPFMGHTNSVMSVGFSPDGTRVVSGSIDKTIRVWDVERGKTIVGPLKGHTRPVFSTAFSPDGSQIISCSLDSTLRLWDPRSGDTIGNPYEGHTGDVNSAAFSPRGTYVISGGDDKAVRLWDTRTGRQVDRPFEEHSGAVCSVAFSPCGQYIVSGSDDRKVITRSILGIYPEPPSDLEPHATPEGEGNSLRTATPQMIVGHMSTQEMFDCLIVAGCINLSSQMDTNQDTARIVSGGGFGDIWMGQLRIGRKVAIKAWRTNALEQCDRKTLKRAAREIYYWSRMKHKNIHQLMGVIIFKDEYLGMVSEWMENGDLHNYLLKNPGADRYQLVRALNTAAFLALTTSQCIDVASGLDYMHSQSTVHGDLKAANVLVSSDGIARLSDFDFSVMSNVTSLVFTASSNSRTGSVRWVAPEMLPEDAPKRTKQSDVYALGMTMLEIFTGEVPYPHIPKDFSVMRAVSQGTLPVRPTEQLKDNHQGNVVWRLLLKCWSRNVDERPLAGHVVAVLVFNTET
ncbi:hypothetical protein RSAG8_08168, partial [Rhizoctonia solani AG-8 WAC10335]